VPQPWWLVLGTFEALIVGAWLLERSILRRIRTESGDPIGAARTDRSFIARWLLVFFLLQLLLSRAGRLPQVLPRALWISALGAAIAVAGLWIRVRAIQALRENFSYVVNVGEKHRLITTGLYRRVRHPAYTGLIVYFVGLPLVTADLLLVVPSLVVVLLIVLRRIRIEERWLRDHFGAEYEAWSARTKLLIPYVL
jgi:protein-S-isoprenylcysteine O-methyltransferase Ste14